MKNLILRGSRALRAIVSRRPKLITSSAGQTQLGHGWAGNTVNTAIFRHHGIISRHEYQFSAYYASPKELCVCRRNLRTNSVETFGIAGHYNLVDAHNSISLGLDADNFLHITYDHHSSRLNYRRGLKALEIDEWTEPMSMTGLYEESVTYPCFVSSLLHPEMLLVYRVGKWNDGAIRIKAYSSKSQSWCDYPAEIISGRSPTPWTSNPYLNHPVVDENGVLHLSFTWRTDAVGPLGAVNNLNVCYAASHDWGKTWRTSANFEYKLPVTPVNAETILAIGPGSNHINQNSMCVDGLGRIHIALYSNDAKGVPQFRHLWNQDGEWKVNTISSRSHKFNLLGGGTLQVPVSRPQILCDAQSNIYVLFRDHEFNNKMMIQALRFPGYHYDPSLLSVLVDRDMGYSEPVIDHARWGNEKVLSVLVQRNQQPPGDRSTPSHYENISTLDFTLRIAA